MDNTEQADLLLQGFSTAVLKGTYEDKLPKM